MEIKTTAPQRGLLVLCLSSFLVPFMGSALNLALPQISEAFSMKAITLTWMTTIYLISTAVFQIPFAKLGDMFGRKKIFISGIFIFSVATILCALAPSSEIFIVLRFFAGIGSAMLFGTGVAILTALFPPNRRGYALGVNTSVVYLSLAAGPLLGGLLTHYFGWQSIFIFCGCVGFIAIALSGLFLKGEWIEAKNERFDILGAVIYAVGLFGLIYGFSNFPKPIGFICFFGGIVFFILFACWEKRNKFPIVDINLFSHNRVFTLSCVAALINYASTSAVTFMLSLYLQYIRGFEPRLAGLVLVSQATVQAIVTLYAGRLSDKSSPSRYATAGMIIIVIGLGGLLFLSAATPLAYLIAMLILLGIGFGVFSAPNMSVIMNSVEKQHYGQASATTGTARLIGQALSMGIAGMAISLQLGDKRITPDVFPDFMHSMFITFIVFVVLCLFGIYASSIRDKKR